MDERGLRDVAFLVAVAILAVVSGRPIGEELFFRIEVPNFVHSIFAGKWSLI
jgi:hypothetical protein